LGDRRNTQFDLNDLDQYEENEKISLAIRDRVSYARSTNLFGPMDLRGLLTRLARDGGGAVILNISRTENRFRRIIVGFIQKLLAQMTERGELRSACLYLEEAQTHVQDDEIQDFLTRMRHIGVYPTFITNDPQTLPPEIFSLADNLISFRFKSDLILNQLSRTGMIDSDSVKALRILDPRQCLAIGTFTNNFPLYLEIEPQSGVKMAGKLDR
jgi:hypothetical protein